MRVVIASDAIAGLDPRDASELLARAFADRGVLVAVAPLGVAGRPLREGIAACAPEVTLMAAQSSSEAGEALRSTAPSLLLDLTAATVDDLGAAALGPDPVAGLAQLREAWEGRALTALVPEGHDQRALTGLDGYASVDLRAQGADLQAVLAADAKAEAWAGRLGIEPLPGDGAAGGLGLLIRALGGTLADPLSFLIDRLGLADTIASADLIVTGAESLDFHALGGPIVKRIAAMAGEALRPVIAVVGRNYVSARELRLGGFETAYPLLQGAGEEQPSIERLREVSEQVARTWQWA